MDLEQLQAEPAVKPAVVWVPVMPQTREGFDVLQRFEGTVRVGARTIRSWRSWWTKPMRSLEEEAEIPLAEIMPGDHELVKSGAVFIG